MDGQVRLAGCGWEFRWGIVDKDELGGFMPELELEVVVCLGIVEVDTNELHTTRRLAAFSVE